MPKIRSLTPGELIKILLKKGFVIDRISGSHHILLNEIDRTRVIVPLHKKDLPKGTLHDIIKKAGLTPEDIE